MTEIFSKDNNFKWHHGKLGGYVQDENDCLYGITCRHVTQAASDGIIYVKDKNCQMRKFGRTVKPRNDYKIKEDIDLICIDDAMLKHCQRTMKNSKGNTCAVCIYDGPIGMIFGRSLFVQSLDTLKHPMVCFTVASAEHHYQLKEKLDTEENFLIESSSFLNPGDSGNILALEDGDKLLLVGLILGGKVLLNDLEFGLCMRLNYGLELLKNIYEKSLRLPDELTDGIYIQQTSDLNIRVGICIWVKVPEDIAKSDFVLFEHLILLIECFTKELSTNSTRLENFFEEQLSKHVNARNDSIHIINCESTDEKCFLECMIGCEYLYSGKFDQSDIHLKEAVRLISKTSCRNRLLCKLITYSTWQLLQTKQLDNMRKLLECGENYMLQMQKYNACPLKSIGYHYFDFARYYSRAKNVKESMVMAKRSLEYFQLDEKLRGKPSHGKCFALAMIARLNLMCGDNFETKHMPMIDLNEAEDCIIALESSGELPAVEKTTYLLVKIDYHYRRGEIDRAKKCARECVHLAVQNNLQQEKDEAIAKIKALASISSFKNNSFA